MSISSAEMATALHSRQGVPHKLVSEATREGEMFRHWPRFQHGQRTHDFRPSTEDTGAERLSSGDVILTALAQLGIYQVGAQRAFISLFDSECQYIIAEATSGTCLRPSAPNHKDDLPLKLCGISAPRGDDVCDHALLNRMPGHHEGTGSDASQDAQDQLSVTVISNLAQADHDGPSRPPLDLHGTPFYATVPIRTKRGINIGLYSVVDTSATRQWTELHSERLCDISLAISDHLEVETSKVTNRRNARMNRGLGSFLEGKSTLSGWHLGSDLSAFTDVASMEGTLNRYQQSLQTEEDAFTARITALSSLAPEESQHVPTQADDVHTDMLAPTKQASSAIVENQALENVFSRAANIIRESVEVEGCFFLDTRMAGYRVHKAETSKSHAPTGQCSSTSSDENTDRQSSGEQSPDCEILGFSTSTRSSIDRGQHIQQPVCLSEKFMRRLLKRYPHGKVFNFCGNGELQTSDSSSSEQLYTQKHQLDGSTRQTKHRLLSRQREGKTISAAFPGARSVAFFPVRDPGSSQWRAGGLVYTNSPDRIFTVEGELSYLRALGLLAAAEISRMEVAHSDKAKTDALGSLSHELRSPLHGVLLSTELMADTELNVFQSNIAHTMETCSRTLLDTIDHLLDYSRVSSFADASNIDKSNNGNTLKRLSVSPQGDFGKKSLVNDYPLDSLVEDVVESVFAGFNFQHRSISQHVARQQLEEDASRHADNAANSALDYMEAMDQLSPGSKDITEHTSLSLGKVAVVLSLDAESDWLFHFHLGAVRRIVMNIFGNSLKYTRRGTISVSLSQEIASIRHRKPEQVIRLRVEDTGIGIGEEYLQKRLFRPFSQEDDLSSGTGLGLSLVKRIVTQLRGQVHVESQVDVGTVVNILLPLARPARLATDTTTSAAPAQDTFHQQVRDLKGLRVRFMSSTSRSTYDLAVHDSLEHTCREWLKLHVLHEDDVSMLPDLMLWTQDALPTEHTALDSIGYLPNVVLCTDALSAYERALASSKGTRKGVFEFISQPFGPRKLAKTLLLAYTRWTKFERASVSPSGGPGSLLRPPAPSRDRSTSSQPSSAKDSQLAALPSKPEFPSQEKQTEPHSPTNIALVDAKPLPAHTESPDAPPPPPAHLSVQDTTTKSLDTAKDTPQDYFSALVDPKSEAADDTKILLVDDNLINLKILSAYMRKLKLTYDTAIDGQRAVDQYKRAPKSYACILLDISMPVMDGFEAARHIRAFEDREQLGARVPIFALSGLASESAQREAYGSGFDLFLLKPVRLELLAQTLEEQGIIKLQPSRVPTSVAIYTTHEVFGEPSAAQDR